MADDLEAFLRQAAQRRAQRQATTARPLSAAPPASRPPAAATPPRPAAPAPPLPPRLAADSPPVRPAQPAPRRLTPAAESSRVGTRVDTAEFAQRAEQLGEEVGLADEHMEAHIASRFDHQVGSMETGDAGLSSAAPGAVSLDAADLMALLHNPRTVRHAVLLSEILNPLRDRW